MKIIETYKELSEQQFPETLRDTVESTFKACLDVDDNGIDPSREYLLDEVMGGDVFVLETPDDLALVSGQGYNPNLYDDNLKNNPCVFDFAEVYDGWAYFVVICNNVGGPSFLVPPGLFSENVKGSIRNYERDMYASN